MIPITMSRKTDFYGGTVPEQMPAYRASEVADFLQLPESTVRAWAYGTRQYRRVIRPADAKKRLLSFENLIEVHVLSSLRREHKVQLQAVRKAINFLRRKTGSTHPLADSDMLTDGTHLFVDEYGRLTNVSQEGQQTLRGVVMEYLKRIERTPAGKSIRLFPVTRDGITVDVAPKAVAIDPRYRFGQPFLTSCDIETRVVAGRYRAGDSVRDLAADLGVSEDAIDEAIRYELRSAA